MEDLKKLKSLFPDVGDSELKKALSLSGGRVEQAAEAILDKQCHFSHDQDLSVVVQTEAVKNEVVLDQAPSHYGRRWKKLDSNDSFFSPIYQHSSSPKTQYPAPLSESIGFSRRTRDQDLSRVSATGHPYPTQVPLQYGEYTDVYRRERREAEKIRKQRDKHSRQALQAGLLGDDDSMRLHHDRARELQERFVAEQSAAASRIFAFFNHMNAEITKKSCEKVGCECWRWIDLHGLHAEEAIKFLSMRINSIAEVIESLANQNQKNKVDHQENHRGKITSTKPVWLNVITGRGGHQPGYSILKPAITSYLEKNQLCYRVINDGSYFVWVTPYKRVSS